MCVVTCPLFLLEQTDGLYQVTKAPILLIELLLRLPIAITRSASAALHDSMLDLHCARTRFAYQIANRMEHHAADRVTRSFRLPVDGPGQVPFDELGMGALAFVPPRVALPALRLAGRASQQSLLRLP